jgi:beta-fructofuranosidase
MPWSARNKYCWDFWFAWKEQKLHIFYLQANRLACAYNADKRHNLASVGHAVLTDFGWQEINPDKPAFSIKEGDFWDNLSIWTGSIIEKDGLYYLFYTARRKEDSWVQSPHQRRLPKNVGVAVSEDLSTWTRTSVSLEKPVIPNPGVDSDFDGMNWHDPYVIKDDTDGKFYAFICAHPKDTPADVGGVVAYATSKDLENWQDEPYKILYASDEFYLTEVPQVFWRKMNDQKHWRLYLFGKTSLTKFCTPVMSST